MKAHRKIVIILAFLLGLTSSVTAETADSTWYDEMWLLAEKLLYERIEANNKLISEGRVDETDYIIDMYAAIIGRGKDFVNPTAKAALQQKLRNVHLEGDATKEKVNPYVIIGLPTFKVEVHVDPTQEAALHRRRAKIFKLRNSYEETLTATLVLNGLVEDRVNAQGQVEVYAAHYTLAAASRWLDAKLNISLYSVWNSQRQAYGLVTALPTNFTEGTLPSQTDRATYLNQEVDHFIGLLQRKPTAPPRDPFAVTCDMDIVALKELTQANRQRDYSAVSSRFLSVINGANSINGSVYIKADTVRAFMDEDVFSGEVLPDKFKALENGNSEYRVHLIYAEVSFALNNAEWSVVAEQVHRESGLSPKEVLIIVPYYRTESQCGAFSRLLAMRVYEKVSIIMPAAYCPEGALMGQINAELIAASEWETRMKNAYKHIPKKRVVYAYSFLWNGDFIKHDKKVIHTYEAGHENVYEVLIKDDSRFEELRSAESSLHTTLNAFDHIAREESSLEEMLNEWALGHIDGYFEQVAGIMAMEDPIKIKTADDILQSILNSETNADIYAHWLWRRKTGSSIAANLGWTGQVPADEWFYGEVNTASAADFLIVIDAASFVASFVGLDVVFDTWGFYYALDKGMTTEAAIYATAATIGVVTAGEMKLVMAGLRRAELAVVKTFYNTSIKISPVASRAMYCSFFPIVVKLDLNRIVSKALVSRITNKETFLRIIAYAKKAEHADFVKTLEKACEESAAMRDLINQEPAAVSAFFEYMKLKPGALADEVLDVQRLAVQVPAAQMKEFLGDVADEAFLAVMRRPGMVDAWTVLRADPAFRKSAADLEKISAFIRNSGFDKGKLAESFANTRNARAWIDAKIPEADLNNIYNGFKNNPPSELVPWTPQHKAQRWEQYKQRVKEEGGTQEPFETWSNRYDGNIDKSNFATRATDDYYNSLNFPCSQPSCREVSIRVNGEIRRLDIADINAGKAIEFKKYAEGKVYRSEDIMKEVMQDKALLEQGTMQEIEWVFMDCVPSGPLERELLNAGIKIKLLP